MGRPGAALLLEEGSGSGSGSGCCNKLNKLPAVIKMNSGSVLCLPSRGRCNAAVNNASRRKLMNKSRAWRPEFVFSCLKAGSKVSL